MDILYIDINDNEISLLLTSAFAIIKKELHILERTQFYNLSIFNMACLVNIINTFYDFNCFKNLVLIISIGSKNLHEIFDSNSEYDFDDKKYFCINYPLDSKNKVYHVLVNNNIIFQCTVLASMLNLNISIITTKFLLLHTDKTVKDIDLIKALHRIVKSEKT